MTMTKGTLTVIKIEGQLNSLYTIECRCGFIHKTYKSRWLQYGGRGCRKCWIKKLGLSRRTINITQPLEYNSWRAMRERCNNPKYWKYDRYGGRGITVCERWSKFANFLEDMGSKPSPKHSIDRIDNDGDYEPSNCKWSTQTEQVRSSGRSRKITFMGVSKPVAQWAEEYNLPPKVVYKRIWRGWTPQQALETPLTVR